MALTGSPYRKASLSVRQEKLKGDDEMIDIADTEPDIERARLDQCSFRVDCKAATAKILTPGQRPLADKNLSLVANKARKLRQRQCVFLLTLGSN